MTTLRVAAVQSGECTSDIAGNLTKLEGVLARAADTPTDLVVLPELCALPYFPVCRDRRFFELAEPIDGPTVTRLRQRACLHSTAVVMGIFEKTTSGDYYDSAIVADRSGTIVMGRTPTNASVPAYRKMMIPSVVTEEIDSDEKFYFRPGPGPAVFDLDGVRLGVLICYDRSFAEAWRALTMLGAQVVALPMTSLAWRQDVFIAELQTRALENGVYVIAANRGGPETINGATRMYFGLSCIIAPDGTVLDQAPANAQPAVVRAELNLDAVEEQRRRLPLWRDRRRDLAQLFLDHDIAG